MTQLDKYELGLLNAYEAEQVASVASTTETRALRVAARVTMTTAAAAQVLCEGWNAVIDQAGNPCADDHSPL